MKHRIVPVFRVEKYRKSGIGKLAFQVYSGANQTRYDRRARQYHPTTSARLLLEGDLNVWFERIESGGGAAGLPALVQFSVLFGRITGPEPRHYPRMTASGGMRERSAHRRSFPMIRPLLASQAESRPGHRVQSLSGNGVATVNAHAVAAILGPLQSFEQLR
jgi:hypothetical protein